MLARFSSLFTPSLHTLALIWIGWAAVLLLFQMVVEARFEPDRPDEVLLWTANETTRRSQNDKPYLMEPFMNRHVSWDSEFYLSIAVAGYDDPAVRVVNTPDGDFSMNSAFFPFYPYSIRALSQPLSLLGKNKIATATLAGVIVSLIGTLIGMLSLYDITRAELGEEGGLRTAFYFLIFPSSFFLAQVYTEGLFAGLAFGTLALAQRKHLLLAGVLAALATWTRATGAVLALPLGIIWLQSLDRQQWQANLNRQAALQAFGVILPVLAYLVWHSSQGEAFTAVETSWFGRGLLDLERTQQGFDHAWEAIQSGDNLARRLYYIMEFGAVGLALLGCLTTLRRYPGIALFGLIAILIPLTSGWPQSLIRYMVVIPPLFIMTGRWGRSMAFDRVWTVACLLLLGMQAALFTFDMWVA